MFCYYNFWILDYIIFEWIIVVRIVEVESIIFFWECVDKIEIEVIVMNYRNFCKYKKGLDKVFWRKKR